MRHTAAMMMVFLLAGSLGAQQAVKTSEGNLVLQIDPQTLKSPWAMAFLPGGDLLVSGRLGDLALRSQGRWSFQTLAVPGLRTSGQGGLLGLALDPGFSKNSKIYWAATRTAAGQGVLSLLRGTWTGNQVADLEILWTSPKGFSSTGDHGSRLVFGPGGELYMSTGHQREPSRAQDPQDFAGKILKFTPQDLSRTPGTLKPEVFSLGHRNIQGMVWDPGRGVLWATEHGPKGGDELNQIQAGGNYGWPLVTFGVNYDGSIISTKTEAPGLISPKVQWTPSIAPSGLLVYTGNLFPKWKGQIFAGFLAGTQVRRIDPNQGFAQESLLKGTLGRIRDLAQGPEGFIYGITDGATGNVWALGK